VTRAEAVLLDHAQSARPREQLDPRERTAVRALHAGADDVRVVVRVVRLVGRVKMHLPRLQPFVVRHEDALLIER
jgi:hypothetical protein